MISQKILIVNDEKNIHVSFVKCLAEAGYSVVAVPDGQSALQALANDTFSLVLLEMKFPAQNSLDVLRKIKEAVPSQRVMIITDGNIQKVAEEIKFEAVDYLPKPFSPDELRQAVSRSLASAVRLKSEPGATVGECIKGAHPLAGAKAAGQAFASQLQDYPANPRMTGTA